MYKKLAVLLLLTMCFPVAMAALTVNSEFTLYKTDGVILVPWEQGKADQICQASAGVNSHASHQIYGQNGGAPANPMGNWTGSFNVLLPGYNTGGSGIIANTSSHVQIYCANNAFSGNDFYLRYYQVNAIRPPTANVIFDIALSGNFTQPISGALITISNGQTNTTLSDGRALIPVTPSSALYTYTITKTGYAGIFNADLGNLGLNGGTAYLTLAPSTNTTPQAGYTRTTVYATDGSTGGTIVGATLNLRDVQNNTWVNATSTITGTIIDVQTGHTIDIYGTYPGVYTASSELGATAGGNYYLPLMPPLPTPPGGLGGGYVNLIVNTFDASTNNMLPSVSLTTRLPTGATTGENSGISGTAVFLVPNNTVVILGASKAGYASMSQSFNSGTGADKIVNMKLTRATVTTAPVTPVVTDPGTGAVITAVPTIDARTSNQKDLDMMNLLRDNGGTIVSLAIVAILFGLLKMIMKF